MQWPMRCQKTVSALFQEKRHKRRCAEKVEIDWLKTCCTTWYRHSDTFLIP